MKSTIFSTALYATLATSASAASIVGHASGVANAVVSHSAAANGGGNGSLLYVGDRLRGVVYVYPEEGNNRLPVGEITGFMRPWGLWVDEKENLYVADPAAGTVTGYHRGATKPFVTMSDSSIVPSVVCGDTSGHVFVASESGSQVDVYRRGSTSPQSHFDIPNANTVRYCAFDNRFRVLYTVYGTPSGIEQVGASSRSKGTWTTTALGITPQFALGLAVDASHNLVLDDQIPQTITSYAPVSSNKVSSFTYTGFFGNIAFDQSGKHLWGISDVRVALEYAYPVGTLSDQTGRCIRGQGPCNPFWTALSPALLP